MRAPMLGAVLVVCACASGGQKSAGNDSPLEQQRVEFTRIETPNGIIQIDWQRERTYDETNLIVDVDRAWATLPTVFGELGIQPSLIDSKQHVFGNAGVNLRRQLGGQRISRYIDCGSTAGISNSDDYDVLVRVISQIVPADGGLSRLRTQVEATAHATSVSGQVVRCSSTGALEERISHMVSDQAARAAAK